MKISKPTLDILKNFSSINGSILIKKGDQILTKSTNNNIYAIAKIEDAIDFDMGIYDLGQFLNLMALFGTDTELTVDGASLVLKNGKSSAKTSLSDPSVIVHPKSVLSFPVADVMFDLSQDHIQKLLKSAAMLGLTQIKFSNTADSDKIVASGWREESQNEYAIEVADYDGDASFEFNVAVANLKLIDGDYKVSISQHGAIQFEGSAATYIVALEANTVYND